MPTGSGSFVMDGGPAVVVFLSLGESISVQLEDEGSYSPDVMDDLCTRARDLFRLALADVQHAETEHRPE